MRKFYIMGWHNRKSTRGKETAICIMDAENAEAALEKARNYYGYLYTTITGAMEAEQPRR